MGAEQAVKRVAHNGALFDVRTWHTAAMGTTSRDAERLHLNTYRPGSLPPRVCAALDLLCRGLTYTEIAREMALSPHTVHTMLQHAYRSLDVRNKGEAIVAWLPRRGYDAGDGA